MWYFRGGEGIWNSRLSYFLIGVFLVVLVGYRKYELCDDLVIGEFLVISGICFIFDDFVVVFFLFGVSYRVFFLRLSGEYEGF